MNQGKWVDQIAQLQLPDGSWGYFHSLSRPTKAQPMTTEQALRRLLALGLSRDDELIMRTIHYMKAVLARRIAPPDSREKVLNWDFFEQMMMAAWIKSFDPDDEQAAEIACFWAEIICAAFADGKLNHAVYEAEYRRRIPKLHGGERLIGIPQYYMVMLLKGMLDAKTESAFVAHIVNHPSGIYYVYDECIAKVPETFCSLQASRYLSALECLSGYRCAPENLRFATDWVLSQKSGDGWDLGPLAKDGIYFPISDSWRKPENRIDDCTRRVCRIIARLDVCAP